MRFAAAALLLLAVLTVPLSAESGDSFVAHRIEFQTIGTASPFQLAKIVEIRRGDTVDPAMLDKQLELIDASGFYRDLSWAIKIDDKGKTTVVFSVTAIPGRVLEPDEKITVDAIVFSGNYKTRDSVILSEFVFSVGDTIGIDEVEQTLANLRKREYFFVVEYGIHETEKGSVFQLRVKEKLTIFPIISVRGDDVATELRLGAVDFNLFGLGFTLMADYRATFMTDGPVLNNFSVTYLHRKVGGTPIRIYSEILTQSQLRYVRDDAGVRVGSFSQEGLVGLAVVGYGIRDVLIPNIGLIYKNSHVQGAMPPDYSQSLLAPQGGLVLDLSDQVDHRRAGFFATVEYAPVFTVSGLWESFQRVHSLASYSTIFAARRLNLFVQWQLDYSSSSLISNQPDMQYYLRGGSGREYFYNLIHGGLAEFSVTPVMRPWMVLDLAVFGDLAFGGDNLGDSYDRGAHWRAGFGIRYSLPVIAKMVLTLDLAWTERGDIEIFFGMRRFYDRLRY